MLLVGGFNPSEKYFLVKLETTNVVLINLSSFCDACRTGKKGRLVVYNAELAQRTAD